jgi:hypothetical protein
MKLSTLNEAIWVASRFNTAARRAQEKLTQDKSAVRGCKETAAVKRASMDLTRALAELRKPG